MAPPTFLANFHSAGGRGASLFSNRGFGRRASPFLVLFVVSFGFCAKRKAGARSAARKEASQPANSRPAPRLHRVQVKYEPGAGAAAVTARFRLWVSAAVEHPEALGKQTTLYWIGSFRESSLDSASRHSQATPLASAGRRPGDTNQKQLVRKPPTMAARSAPPGLGNLIHPFYEAALLKNSSTR